jgi:hypothetical protein
MLYVMVSDMFFEPPPEDQLPFWKHVFYEALAEDSCWVWKGWKTGSGYPVFRLNGQQVSARRYSWEKRHGPIPAGHFVKHKKPNRIDCVNPEHLFVSETRLSRKEMADQNHSWTVRGCHAKSV